MKISLYLFAAWMLVSCDAPAEVKEQKEQRKQVPKVTACEMQESAPGTDSQASNGNTPGLRILVPATYREWEGKTPVDELTKDWIELYRKNGRYYLQKADFKVEAGSDECSGSDTKTIVSKKDVLLLMNLPDLELGQISSVKIPKSKIWPKEKAAFQFNGTDYFLRAEGDILSGDETAAAEDRFHDVKNYKLFISTNTMAETLFLEEKTFNDTFVELLFAGDIDRDGKLDFIVSAARDYEEHRVILFLSSKAKAGGMIKNVAEIAIQFDC